MVESTAPQASAKQTKKKQEMERLYRVTFEGEYFGRDKDGPAYRHYGPYSMVVSYKMVAPGAKHSVKSIWKNIQGPKVVKKDHPDMVRLHTWNIISTEVIGDANLLITDPNLMCRADMELFIIEEELPIKPAFWPEDDNLRQALIDYLKCKNDLEVEAFMKHQEMQEKRVGGTLGLAAELARLNDEVGALNALEYEPSTEPMVSGVKEKNKGGRPPKNATPVDETDI